ncbi:hypothetical protein I4U23_027125 [Adineta vaga]|nr:hypothetical protein I4U23_027125 [Adineta vaga]
MVSKRMEMKEVNILKTRQYIESSIIVWLNNAINTNNHSTQIIEQLKVISNDIKIFNDSNECIDYITDLENENILLIVSGTIIDSCIFTLVEDLLSISDVYILCLSNEDMEKKWSKSIRKIKGVYTNVNRLINQIKFDTNRIEHDSIGFEVLEVSDISLSIPRYCNKQECTFMYSQLLKEVLLRFEDDSTTEFVEYCRKLYSKDPPQLVIIDEFERQYDKRRAIWWYTRDCFLHKLMNKALRTRDVETLYNMRTFLRHLHQELVQLRPKDDHIQSASILTLYRGQKLSFREFDKLKNNEGGLLSVSNFVSTTTSQDVAIIFAGQSDHETVAIVFKFNVNLNDYTNNSFGCIEKFSNFGEAEHEWLFSMGTVFRIQNIELIDNVWHVGLILTNDQDETLAKLTIHMNKIIQLQRPNPLVPLCRLFVRMDEHKKAIELCENHIASENDWEMKATLYDTLAWINGEKENQELALEYHQKALNIIAEHVDTNDPLLAYYYSNVAISCSAVNKDQQAIDNYNRSIELEINASQPDYTNIAYSYESIGTILQYCFNKYNEAMNYYERALELMLVHLPIAHSDTISLYNDMANIYEELNELDKALNILYTCLGMIQNKSEYNPHDLALVYKHIAQIYKKQKKFDEASEMLNKCHAIKTVYPSSKELNLENINTDDLFAKIFQYHNAS